MFPLPCPIPCPSIGIIADGQAGTSDAKFAEPACTAAMATPTDSLLQRVTIFAVAGFSPQRRGRGSARATPQPVLRCLATLLALLVHAASAALPAGDDSQRSIARVQLMAKTPEPLFVRDWSQVSRLYYDMLFDPATRLDGKALVARHPEQHSFDSRHE